MCGFKLQSKLERTCIDMAGGPKLFLWAAKSYKNGLKFSFLYYIKDLKKIGEPWSLPLQVNVIPTLILSVCISILSLLNLLSDWVIEEDEKSESKNLKWFGLNPNGLHSHWKVFAGYILSILNCVNEHAVRFIH